jgi:hypothetical protein
LKTVDISQDQRGLRAVFQARCGRSSRISAEPIGSVTDNLMENSKSSDGEIEEIKLARSLRGAPCATKQWPLELVVQPDRNLR